MATIRKKTWPEFFEKIISGQKKFDVRVANFDINEGDILIFEEWNPDTQQYTGRKIEVTATFILKTKDQTFWSDKEIAKYGFQVIQFDRV